jgi:uncharacterized membrane protein
MNTFIRLIRHLLTTSASGRRAFPTATLQVIEQRIAEGESQHRAEIRLFAQYGIWDTEENCGMLVYINMADHKIEIVTDRGIGKKVAAEVWQAICNDMTQGFKQDAYLDSTLAALGKINALLQQHFPATGSRINQLPNRPLML